MSDSRAPYAHVGVSIVAYQPQAETLVKLLEAISSQVRTVVLVDNGGAAEAVGASRCGHIVILDPGCNVGLAAGHNLALARIFAAGCSHALLFDQDSVPQGDMLGELLRIEQRLTANSHSVGAVGPLPISEGDSRTTGFVRFSGLWRDILSHADADLPAPACRCDFLITSGTLLRREVFDRVGPFAESLFIDNVDLEWCCRAGSLGYEIYGAAEARMQHALGDRLMLLPVAGKRALVIHNPLRIYYMTRNRLLLYRMPHIPLGWKLADFPRLVIKTLLFGLLAPPRLRYLRATLAGMLDGLWGRDGPARRPF
ncbi:MAG: glycosyltransferase family 2 protein [Betaproteobacteria bacterium]|nr:glycosyltransferase family 2 protein [Betaproteobacteria bacterium]